MYLLHLGIENEPKYDFESLVRDDRSRIAVYANTMKHFI